MRTPLTPIQTWAAHRTRDALSRNAVGHGDTGPHEECYASLSDYPGLVVDLNIVLSNQRLRDLSTPKRPAR